MSTIQCDNLIQQFHRFDESKNKWKGGSVTSICRGWGSTKKASLQSMYEFVRHKFFLPEWDGEEKFPVTLYHSQATDDDLFGGSTTYASFRKIFSVENGSGSVFFRAMYVTHGNVAINVGSSVPSQNVGTSFYPFQCDTNAGTGSYTAANSICLDNLERSEGSFTISSGNAKDDWEFSMYDFNAFKLVGTMYDDLIRCAVSASSKRNKCDSTNSIFNFILYYRVRSKPSSKPSHLHTPMAGLILIFTLLGSVSTKTASTLMESLQHVRWNSVLKSR